MLNTDIAKTLDMQNVLCIFEKKFALYILASVKDNPGFTKTDIIRLQAGNERTKFVRINELIKEGLISVKNEGSKWNSMQLYLTPKGIAVAAAIDEMEDIMHDAKISPKSDAKPKEKMITEFVEPIGEPSGKKKKVMFVDMKGNIIGKKKKKKKKSKKDTSA